MIDYETFLTILREIFYSSVTIIHQMCLTK